MIDSGLVGWPKRISLGHFLKGHNPERHNPGLWRCELWRRSNLKRIH
jgi:hypothetical protein